LDQVSQALEKHAYLETELAIAPAFPVMLGM